MTWHRLGGDERKPCFVSGFSGAPDTALKVGHTHANSFSHTPPRRSFACYATSSVQDDTVEGELHTAIVRVSVVWVAAAFKEHDL